MVGGWSISLMKKLHLLFLLKVISESCEFEIVCPAASEWDLRARAMNCTGKYVCLQRLPNNDYIEKCNGPNLSNKGTKLVFQPLYNNAKCSKKRFQPFRFSTDSTSMCIYQKSFCNEEGQFVFHHGGFRDDTRCGCNISKGYDFLIKPINDCFCIPSKEDCSCYKDDQCLQEGHVFTNNSCPEIQIEMSQRNDIHRRSQSEVLHKSNNIDQGTAYIFNSRISTTVLAVLIFIILISVGYFCNGKEKMESEKEDEFPCSCCIGKKIYCNELQKWKQKEKTFVVTRAYEEVIRNIILYPCVAVTGVGGCGKSSIVWHTAFTLQKKHRYVNIVEIKNAADLESQYKPNTKTVFVLDDIWGKFTVNEQQIEKWNSIREHVRKVVSDSSCKILLSCRLQVYKDTKLSEFEDFISCECNIISENLCLTTKEKKAIFKKYMKKDSTELAILDGKHDMFPLLCELYSKGKKSLCIEKYFTTPYEIYREELDILRKEDNFKLCGLVLCTMLNNKLEEKDVKTMSEDICKIVDNIFCHLELEKERCRYDKEIKNALKTLEGTFVKVQNGFYMIIHDTVFDILAYYFGQIMIRELIKDADSEFLRERFRWGEAEENVNCKTEYIINFGNTILPLYIGRLISDWENKNIFEVFCNKNMKKNDFRKEFIKCLNTFPEEFRKKLANTWNDLKNHFAAGNTPLIIASSEGHVDLIEWLLRHDANVNHSRQDGVSALYMASQKGHLNAVKALLGKNADVNATTDEHVTPLGAACYVSGKIDIVRELLLHNADVNKYKFQVNDMTPLFMACQNNFEDIVELLLQNGAKPDICLSDGSSPLLLSCIKGHTNVVRLLLDNKADPNTAISGGYTPLFAAACMGFKDIVGLLLCKDADQTICLANTKEIDDELNPLLLQQNNGKSIPQKRMWSWLDSIVSKCSPAIATYVNSKPESYLKDVLVESTPLHAACFMGHYEIVELLIQELSSVDITKKNGTTPLFYACELGHHDIVKALIEKGADPCWICGADKKSPRQIAKINSHNKLLPLLKKK